MRPSSNEKFFNIFEDTDIIQGRLDDCWFTATLTGLIAKDLAAIMLCNFVLVQNMNMNPEYDGTMLLYIK